jgi:hypothetical protein
MDALINGANDTEQDYSGKADYQADTGIAVAFE